MYHKTKLYISFFVLVGLMSVVSVLANPAKVEKTRKSENFVIVFQDSKDLSTATKIVSRTATHLYRLSIKQGETISFKLKSANLTSLKVQSPTGIVKQKVDTRIHEGILTGEGEFVFEISTEDFSAYIFEVKRK
jgi:hypothetical protein